MSLLETTTELGIFCIRLNRPEAKNAISKALLVELEEAVKTAFLDMPSVVLFFGSGGSFSAGADLKERETMVESEVIQFLNSINRLFLQIQRLPMPTLACIDGYAFGGGLELALSCDLRYASTDSLIGLTETKLGIIPGAGGTQRLTEIVGSSKAKELIFRANRISAETALKMGVVNSVFPKSEFEEKCLEIAKEISGSAPIAVRAAKQSINGFGKSIDSNSIDWERTCYEKTLKTDDRKEALLAFKEKRSPRFFGK